MFVAGSSRRTLAVGRSHKGFKCHHLAILRRSQSLALAI